MKYHNPAVQFNKKGKKLAAPWDNLDMAKVSVLKKYFFYF